MRKSRKILALALALLMIIGLANPAFANNINNMHDIDDVTPRYMPAVGVLFGLNIMRGTDAERIEPQRDLERSEFAALIFRMMTGGNERVPVSYVQIFDDVPMTDWAVHYIAWAHSQGIIVGRGDGTFGPRATVTLQEAAAMLLRALGRDSTNTEYQGDNWALNAWRDAIQFGLTRTLLGTYDGTMYATREIAAQMVFNALCATRWLWVPGLGIYITRAGTYGDLFGFCHSDAVRGMVMNLGVDEDVVIELLVELPNNGGAPITELSFDGNARPQEVGRIVDAFVNDSGEIIFLHVISTDYVVPARTGLPAAADSVLLRELEVQPGPNATIEEMLLFPNFVLYDETLDLREDERPRGMHEQAVAYVLWDGEFVSAVFATKWIADLMIMPNGDVSLTRLEAGLDDGFAGERYADDDPLTNVDNGEMEVIAAPERIVNNSSVNLNARNTRHFVNVEQIGNNFYITDVEFFIGTADAFQHAAGTLTIDGVTRIFDVDDLNQLSVSLRSIHWEPFTLADPELLPLEFTFWISGVTGAVVAIERAPDIASIAYILRAGERTDEWGRIQFIAEVAYIDGTTAILVTEESFEDFVDSVIWLQEGTRGWVNDGDVSVSALTSDNDELNPRETDNRLGAVHTWTHLIPADVLDAGNAVDFAVGDYEPESLFISSNARFVYLDVADRATRDAELNGIPFTATGTHRGQIAPGTTFWFVQSSEGYLNMVFVIAPHSDFAAGQIVFLPGPFEMHAGGTQFTHIAYSATTGERITINNGVTMQGITTNAMIAAFETAGGIEWDPDLDNAPVDGIWHVPRGFYQVHVNALGVQTLIPLLGGDEDGIFLFGAQEFNSFDSEIVIETVTAAIPNRVYHIDEEGLNQWVNQGELSTIIVDLRGINSLSPVWPAPVTDLVLEEEMTVAFVRLANIVAPHGVDFITIAFILDELD
ncbi:MAG: S-layer homology domain-containing protein [Oscillospiraceae bacterium]|nr:S-layer homology domain-containing protein [Oscillospiraceae bacterium]